jgi:hypothetical protein
MTVCERLRADAPGLASLPPEDPGRRAAWAHAAGCEGCARALREAERLQALLGEWSPAPLSAAAYGQAALAVEAELAKEARRRAAWPMAAAAAFMGTMVAMARHPGGSALDWGTAGVLGAVALALLGLAGRRPRLVVGVAAAAAAGAALLVGRAGPVEPGLGAECLMWELSAAALVLGAGWVAVRGGSFSPARSAAAAAAAGALAGDAALQVTCAAHGVGPHLLAFHAGGVVLAAAVAGLLWRARRPAAA